MIAKCGWKRFKKLFELMSRTRKAGLPGLNGVQKHELIALSSCQNDFWLGIGLLWPAVSTQTVSEGTNTCATGIKLQT